MTGIKNVNFSVWHVLPIALRFAEIERPIVLTADDQQSWPLLPSTPATSDMSPR
jgi:hypothetical protein